MTETQLMERASKLAQAAMNLAPGRDVRHEKKTTGSNIELDFFCFPIQFRIFSSKPTTAAILSFPLMTEKSLRKTLTL